MASYDTVQEAAQRGADVLGKNPQLEAKFFRSSKGLVPVDAGARQILDAANSGIQSTPGLDDLVVQDIAAQPGTGHKVLRGRMDGGEAITIVPVTKLALQ